VDYGDLGVLGALVAYHARVELKIATGAVPQQA